MAIILSAHSGSAPQTENVRSVSMPRLFPAATAIHLPLSPTVVDQFFLNITISISWRLGPFVKPSRFPSLVFLFSLYSIYIALLNALVVWLGGEYCSLRDLFWTLGPRKRKGLWC